MAWVRQQWGRELSRVRLVRSTRTFGPFPPPLARSTMSDMVSTPKAEVIAGALVCIKPGETLTAEDRKVIAEYVEFCRTRQTKRKAHASSKERKCG